MLNLTIQSNEYRLHSDFKRQDKLKRELLSRYKETDEVVITEKGVEIDRMKLADLFTI